MQHWKSQHWDFLLLWRILHSGTMKSQLLCCLLEECHSTTVTCWEMDTFVARATHLCNASSFWVTVAYWTLVWTTIWYYFFLVPGVLSLCVKLRGALLLYKMRLMFRRSVSFLASPCWHLILLGILINLVSHLCVWIGLCTRMKNLFWGQQNFYFAEYSSSWSW